MLCPRCTNPMEYQSSHYNLLFECWESWWKCYNCGYFHTEIPGFKIKLFDEVETLKEKDYYDTPSRIYELILKNSLKDEYYVKLVNYYNKLIIERLDKNKKNKYKGLPRTKWWL